MKYLSLLETVLFVGEVKAGLFKNDGPCGDVFQTPIKYLIATSGPSAREFWETIESLEGKSGVATFQVKGNPEVRTLRATIVTTSGGKEIFGGFVGDMQRTIRVTDFTLNIKPNILLNPEDLMNGAISAHVGDDHKVAYVSYERPFIVTSPLQVLRKRSGFNYVVRKLIMDKGHIQITTNTYNLSIRDDQFKEENYKPNLVTVATFVRDAG